MKKLVRPPTGKTRRKELTIQTVFPLELFEELMAPLTTTDVPELRREEDDPKSLIPTSRTAQTKWFKYVMRKGKVTEKLFRFEAREEANGFPRRGIGCARVQLTAAEQRRGGVPNSMSMVAGNVLVKYKLPVNLNTPPVLTITFAVLTMDANGHITWLKAFEPVTAATLRNQARALLKVLMEDPLNPTSSLMEQALTGTGSSVRAIPPKRQMVVVQ